MKSEYQWTPREGVSLEAVERMRNHFHKPPYPMGEAWFNTKERRLYTELIDQPFENIKNSDLVNILFEISSGTKAFGHRDDWDEWFKFLLPSVILRSDDFLYFKSMVGPHVISAFMSVYWTGIVEEYKGFRDDVMNSLSIWLMNRELWYEFRDEGGRTFPRTHVLDKYEDGAGNLRLDWHSGHSDENLSASMFFCLKYLYPQEIPSWVTSLFAIEDTHWKAALMIWLLGSYDMLNEGVVIPSRVEKSKPDVSWDDSHCLGSTYGSIDAKYPPSLEYNDNKDFLPPENTKVFLEEIGKFVTVDLIYKWSEFFEKDPFVRESTRGVPVNLLEKYT